MGSAPQGEDAGKERLRLSGASAEFADHPTRMKESKR
jgi:hypothetical protein